GRCRLDAPGSPRPALGGDDRFSPGRDLRDRRSLPTGARRCLAPWTSRRYRSIISGFVVISGIWYVRPVPPSAVVPEGPEAPLFLEVRPDSLTDAVYEAIRRGIIDRRLAPGSPVTEAALAEQLGVSKTPVREALLRLKDIGVIEPNG